MRILFSLPFLGVIWLLFWAAFYVAKLSQRPAWRGMQYRATAPLSAWTYRVFYGGKPERFIRY